MSNGTREGTGSKVTSRHLGDLAGAWLQRMGKIVQSDPKAVLDSWTKVVGSPVSEMTKAVKLENGILHVHVRNSTLLSIVRRPDDKKRLIEKINAAVPCAKVVDIVFRIG